LNGRHDLKASCSNRLWYEALRFTHTCTISWILTV